VDLLHQRIMVAEQVTEIDGHFTWGPPKTEAGRRTMTLPAVAAAALAEHLATYSQPGPDGEGLRFHDLRHTSATLSIAAGASTRELMARMGHSSSAAALRYQHVLAGRDTAGGTNRAIRQGQETPLTRRASL
jgi:integrase